MRILYYKLHILEGVHSYLTNFVEFLKRLVVTVICAGSDDAAQNYSPRADRSGEDVLAGPVPIEGSEPAGTQSPRWPQGQVG